MSIHEYDIWPPRQNFQPPLIVTRWQRELNLVAGFAPNGWPMLRLEWGSTCTWTNKTRDLKYSYSKRERQTGWGVHVYDKSGNIIKTLQYGLKDNVPEPNKRYGCAFPINIKEEIGIPRFWISKYEPPSLIGDWNASRQNVLTNTNKTQDMGDAPNEGMYYIGYHMIAYHGSDGSGKMCCDKAKEERRKCIGLYRDPSDLDILYCSVLHQQATIEQKTHNWTEAADENTMRKVLMNLNQKKEDQTAKEREEMKLRIRDTFRTHRAKLTSRKGRDTFIIHRPNDTL
jgi:hypothetical protein